MNSLQKQKLLSQQLFATGSKGDRLHRHQTETQIQRRKKNRKTNAFRFTYGTSERQWAVQGLRYPGQAPYMI